MGKTPVPPEAASPVLVADTDTTSDRPIVADDSHAGHRSYFWRHFVEMLIAMGIGMIAAVTVFLFAIGMTYEEALVRHPSLILSVMAVGMTVPMIGWMTYRGHGSRASIEMGAAMLLPVIPFLCLVWFDVTRSAQCGAYCASTVVTMLAVMSYRRREYAHHRPA